MLAEVASVKVSAFWGSQRFIMIIPPNQLSEDALQGVLEEFIGREGTDYGEQELTLDEKVARLRPQVARGEVLIVFDEFLETLTLMRREDYREQGRDE